MKWGWRKRRRGTMDMLGFLDYCGMLGLEGAELTSYFFEEPLPLARLSAIKRQAFLAGVDITGGAIGNNFTYKPGSTDATSQLDHCRKWIDRFAELGAPVIRIFAGHPKKGTSKQEAVANVAANIETVLPYAENRGVMIGVENHDLLMNIDLMLELLSRFETPWLGVVWDSANLAQTPDPYSDLARIAPYALVAQLKVSTQLNGESVPANLGRMVQLLRDANYGGYLVFEYEEQEDPLTAIPRYIKQLKKLV